MSLFKKDKKENIELIDYEHCNKPLLLLFCGSFCGPCEQYKQVVVSKLKEKHKEKVVVQVIDVNEHFDIANKYNVMSIPKQCFFNDKFELVSEHVGFMTYEDTIKELEKCGLNE